LLQLVTTETTRVVSGSFFHIASDASSNSIKPQNENLSKNVAGYFK
jgi:hypothetical protein